MARYCITNPDGLTDREQEVLFCIRKVQKDRGYPPTVREICEQAGMKSTSTVQYYLDSLEKKGWIRRNPAKSRGIELLREVETDKPEVLMVPVIGDVAAGLPIYAQQNPEEYFPLPASSYGGKEGYMLRVHGDSMIDIEIYDGDKVIVQACDTAENGDIVVALVDDSATVKRFYKEDGHYRLQPENKTMEPIIVEHVNIQGIVLEVLHSLRR